MINFRVAREEWDAAHDHLRKDASDGPHVDGGRIVARAKKHLGRAVPQRDNLSNDRFPARRYAREEIKCKIKKDTYLVRVRAHGDAKRAGEPKIGQLEVVPLVDEEILRLEVAMQDPVRVAVQ